MPTERDLLIIIATLFAIDASVALFRFTEANSLFAACQELATMSEQTSCFAQSQ